MKSEENNFTAKDGAILAAFEFDNLSSSKARIEVRDVPGEDIQVVLAPANGGEDTLLLGAMRDQWGVWIAMNGYTLVGQEDGTRSFIKALIKGLQHVRQITESETTEPTALPVAPRTEDTATV